jgi:predicted Zn-dependent peptidase
MLIFALSVTAPLQAQEDAVLTHRLSNGMSIIVVPLPDVPLSYCRIAYDSGYASDPSGLEGITDFVRRLSFHGTQTLGTKDGEEEERLREEIDKTIKSRERLLERLPKAEFQKIVEFPAKVVGIRDRIKTRLKALAGESLPPMTREEMSEILRSVNEQDTRIRELREEVEKIKKGPTYRSFDQVRILEGKFKADSKKLASLLLADPLKSTYRAGGAIRVGSETLADATVFSALLPANRTELFLWVESKRMSDAHFRYFTDERKRATNEAFDRDAAFSFEDLLRLVTFPDHPYSGTPQGSWEALETCDAETAMKHYRTNYGPDRAHVVVVGDVDPDRVFYLSEQYFGSIRTAPAPDADPSRPAGPFKVHLFGPRPLVEIRYVLPASPHTDLTAFEAFTIHLGRHDRFRTSHVPESQRPQVMEIGFERGALGSVFSIRAVPEPGQDSLSLCETLKGALMTAVESGLSPEELETARKYFDAEAADRFEDPALLADSLAAAAARGDWRSMLPGALDGLDTETVVKTVRSHLEKSSPVEVIVEVKE